MLKKNIILISVFFIVLSCDNDYQYVKVEVDGKNGKIKILSNDYVIDSINIGNYKISYYNAVLLKKNEGKNVISFRSKSEINYLVNNQNINLMCNNSDSIKSGIDIYIRNKKYFGKKLSVDRDKIQRFNIAYLPCEKKTIFLDAVKRR